MAEFNPSCFCSDDEECFCEELEQEEFKGICWECRTSRSWVRERPMQAALFKAIHHGHKKCALNLVELGADVNDLALYGRSAIHEACEKRNRNKITFLMSLNGTLEIPDYRGITPFHHAVLNARSYSGGEVGVTEESISFIKFLLSKGADVNAADDFGYIPLAKIFSPRHKALVMVLVDAGSKVNARHRSMTYNNIISYAIRNQCEYMAVKLILAGVRVRRDCLTTKRQQQAYDQRHCSVLSLKELSKKCIRERCMERLCPNLYWAADRLPLPPRLNRYLKNSLQEDDN